MKKIERLSGILVKLQSRKFITAGQIAEDYGISLRTVYRDLSIIEQSGVPIVAVPGAGYSLVDGYRLPPLMFTTEEAVSFLMAEKQLKLQSEDGAYMIYKSGMDKIRAALRVSERNILEDFEDNIGFIRRSDRHTNPEPPETLGTILRSISDRKIISIGYKAGNSDVTTQREAEAAGIYFFGGHWYLLGWCHLRNDYRTFKLARICSVTNTDKPFSLNHPPFKSLLKQVFSGDKVYRITIKIRKDGLSLTGGNYHHKLTGEEKFDEYHIRHYETFSPELFARWFISFADKAEIIEPDSLNDTVKEIISKMDLSGRL